MKVETAQVSAILLFMVGGFLLVLTLLSGNAFVIALTACGTMIAVAGILHFNYKN